MELWLDVRSAELKKIGLCFSGAFVLLALVVLARAKSEGMFLAAFDAKALPYITAAIACLSLPAVGLFTYYLGRIHPWMAMRRLIYVFCAGLGLLWLISSNTLIATVLFYIWTALGAMLLTSGFWILTAENFAVRRARRLFGIIAAGGTAGAMVMGISLIWVSPKLSLAQLIPILIGLTGLFFFIEYLIFCLPPVGGGRGFSRNGSGKEGDGDPGANEERYVPADLFKIPANLKIIWTSPHIRSIAAIIFVATVASVLVDYQFKEFAQAHIRNGEKLAGFFGAFYGYASVVALVIQLLFTARIMASKGVAFTLAILPGMLLLGSAGFLILPGIVMATLVRGADNTVRKSLHRPMLEFLYVPVPHLVRRKTKIFIDSFLDCVAEGVGAVSIYFWVVLARGESKYLSVPVILLSLGMLYLSRHSGKRYLRLIIKRLKEGNPEAVKPAGEDGIEKVSPAWNFSNIDFEPLLFNVKNAGAFNPLWRPEFSAAGNGGSVERSRVDDTGGFRLSEMLRSTDSRRIVQALGKIHNWDEKRIALVTGLLGRRDLQKTVMQHLLRADRLAVPYLVKLLLDEDADYVIRKKIPQVLARIGGREVALALLKASTAGPFGIRYRAVLALVNIKGKGLNVPREELETAIWRAIRDETRVSRPVWEIRGLLDSIEMSGNDGLVSKRMGTRSRLSLEHIFRMLVLVLDPESVVAALQGILMGDEDYKSLALEYLEQALPQDVRERLWLVIGDSGEHRRKREARPLNQVVSDLMATRPALLHGDLDRDILGRILFTGKK
jgi:ATP/ADP translocase